MGLLIALSILFIILLILYNKYKFSYWKRRGIPHLEPHLMTGNLGDFQWSKAFREVYNKFKGTGPFAGFYLFSTHTALALEPEFTKNVLIKDFHNFDSRGLYCNEVDDPLTGNLFFLNGEKWYTLRPKMSPTFTSGKMKKMYDLVVRSGEALVKVMQEKIGSGSKALEITNILGRYTSDVIGICAFGLECNSLNNPEADFVVMGKKFFTEPRHSRMIEGLIYTFPDLARKLHARVINQEVHDFYMNIVRETIEYRERHGIKRNDFMDMLIDLKNAKSIEQSSGDSSSKPLTLEEVAAQAFVFLVAGFETSSSTMGFALYELAQNLDVQQKLRKDINEVLQKHNQEFSYECMNDMKYLDYVINETLRKHPVIPHLIRKARSRYETSDPRYYIEAGKSVLIPVIAIHNDPEYYPEPEKFIPERFLPEEVLKRPACTFLPFGEGPRNCIGMRFGKMQTAVGLAFLIKNFEFSVAPETEIPFRLNKKNILLNPENGITLKIQRI